MQKHSRCIYGMHPAAVLRRCSAGMNLQLFAEGGGEGAAAAAGEAAAAAAPQAGQAEGKPEEESAAEQAPAEKKTKAGRKSARAAAMEKTRAEVDALLEQTAADAERGDAENAGEAVEKSAEQAKDAKAEPDKGKAFRELVQGEYRDEFAGAIRQATTAAMQQLLGKGSDLEAILNAVAGRYGVQGGDLKALRAAVEGGVVKDDAYFEDLAMKKGISVQLAKEMDRLESENARMKNAEKAARDAEKVRQMQAAWDESAKRIQAEDPGFDLGAALANPDFARMLKLGVPMEAAYRSVYFDDILARKTAQTAKTVEQGVTERIRQRGARPAENGTSPGGAAAMKMDVRKLTREQCEELERRAMRGQKITF